MRAPKILTLCLALTGTLLAEPQDTRLRILTGERLPEVTAASYSRDGRWLALELQQDQVGNAVAVIRLSDFQVFTRRGSCGVFSTKGDQLAFQSEPRSICLWTLPETSRNLPLLSADRVEKLCFSQDGKKLVAVQQHHQLTAWDLETGQTLYTTTLPARAAQIVFSHDGTQFALVLDGKDHQLQLRQTNTGHLLSSRNLGDEWLDDATFNSQGTRLFTLASESIQEWTLPELTEARRTRLPGTQTDLFRSSAATPAIHSSERGTLCIQTNGSTLLLDSQTFQITREVQDTLQSDLAPDESQLWTVDSQGRLNSLPENTPVQLSRPILTPLHWSPRPYLSIGSPLTAHPVAHFQPLQLNKNAQLEWVAWSAADEMAGSANWRKYAKPFFRNHKSPPPERLAALSAAFSQPASLSARATAPVAYTRSSKPIPPGKLLDQVLVEPGFYNQMCSSPRLKPPRELPLYGDYRRDWSLFYISSENFERLRDARYPVLQEIARRLPQALKTAPPARTEKYSFRTETPEQVLEVYLCILLDLNGVEALPALLQLEQGLNAASPYAKNKPSRRYSTHVQVLSVITAILANEQATPQPESKTTYDKKHRDQIIGSARNYLAQVKPTQFRAAAAMPLETTYR